MEVTMGIDIDEIIEGVCDSTEFDRVVDDKLDDAGIGSIDGHEGRLDRIEDRLDEINMDEIIEFVRGELANAGVNAAIESSDTEHLNDRLDRLEATVARQTEALDAAAKLIRALTV